MTNHLFKGAFLIGALAVLGVGTSFFGTNAVALVMTSLIAAVYGLGAMELRQFRQATATLANALARLSSAPATLNELLDPLHPSLQTAVRLRIEGERVALPGPAMTPYLVGLLVMLGMLGTFIGMVVTFSGASFALEGTTDLQAIRAALAAPIKGLGLAFGTSVAGVAASAMLGLMSALCRRERLQAAQVLDRQIATTLRAFSHAHQRQETFKAIQMQAQALPAVADQLQVMMQQIEQLNARLNGTLVGNQERFHTDIKATYSELATSVDKSLKDSLSQSAQTASESLKPVLAAALEGIAHDASLMHERMANTAQTQLDGLAGRLGEQMQHQNSSTLTEISRLVSTSDDLLRARISAEAAWLDQHGARMDQLTAALRNELGALRADEVARGEAAVARLGDLQTAVTAHLTTLGTALEAPITRLIHTASEAPRAAAEVIAQLRQEISHSVARDNELLDERSRIMTTLSTLLDAINHAAAEQRAVIDSLVASSAVALNQAGNQFAEQVSNETSKLAELSHQVSTSAIDVASLGEAFRLAVGSFNDANEKLVSNLQNIEAAMDRSTTRSDEQLAYYVAQAREVIDLSIHSQKEIFDQLRQLPAKQALLADEVN